MNNCGWVRNGGKCIAKRISSCKELSKTMTGTREGVVSYNEQFRIDFDTKMVMLGRLEQENKELKDNWNKLKEGLRSLYNFDEGVVSADYLECIEDTLDKMQEIEGGMNE